MDLKKLLPTLITTFSLVFSYQIRSKNGETLEGSLISITDTHISVAI